MFVILYKVVLCCECVDELKFVPERGKDAQKTNHDWEPQQVY